MYKNKQTVYKETTIGIFGDSFACRAWGNDTGMSWPEILDKKHGYYRQSNFAEPGSSLFFSYNNFLKSLTEFDKVIFVVTSPGRFSLPPHIEVHKQWASRHIVPVSLEADFEGLDSIIKTTTNQEEKDLFMSHRRALEAVENYFAYIYDDNQDVHNNIGLLQNLMAMRPDALIIPTVRNEVAGMLGLPDPSIDKVKFPSVLTDICQKEITVTGNDYYALAGSGRDRRHCHMSETNNEIFADKIAEYIETGNFTLNADDFVYDKDLDVSTAFPRAKL
jgi:hypothetical protein